jgi:hypothetical protein
MKRTAGVRRIVMRFCDVYYISFLYTSATPEKMDEYADKIVKSVSEFIRKYEEEDSIYIMKWISESSDAPALLCAIAQNIADSPFRGPLADRVACAIQDAVNKSGAIQPFDLVGMIGVLRNKRVADAGEGPAAKKVRN